MSKHSSKQTIFSLLYRYLFEGYYFGAIMGSAKIAKMPVECTSYTVIRASGKLY